LSQKEKPNNEKKLNSDEDESGKTHLPPQTNGQTQSRAVFSCKVKSGLFTVDLGTI